jgi:hypothetical protein
VVLKEIKNVKENNEENIQNLGEVIIYLRVGLLCRDCCSVKIQKNKLILNILK